MITDRLRVGYEVNAWTPEATETVHACPSSLLKVLHTANNRDKVETWKGLNPDGWVIYRHVFDDNSTQNISGRVHRLLDSSHQIADLIDFYETPWNEWVQFDAIPVFATAELEAIELIHALTDKGVVAGNWSVGCPPGAPEEVARRWVDYHPVLRCLGINDLLGLHEYGWPRMRTGDGHWTLRYRKVWSLLPESVRQTLRFVINECAVDGGLADPPLEKKGWRSSGFGAETFAEDLSWYFDEAYQDPYVAGIVVYSAGNIPDWGWADFETAGVQPVRDAIQRGNRLRKESPTMDPFDAWASDVFARSSRLRGVTIPYTPTHGIVGLWKSSALNGRYLGEPTGPEHPVLEGKFIIQEFSSAVITHVVASGLTRVGLPFS